MTAVGIGFAYSRRNRVRVTGEGPSWSRPTHDRFARLTRGGVTRPAVQREPVHALAAGDAHFTASSEPGTGHDGVVDPYGGDATYLRRRGRRRPDPDRPVPATDGQPSPSGAIAMGFTQFVGPRMARRVPSAAPGPHRPVAAAAGQPAPVGRDRHRAHRAGVAAHGAYQRVRGLVWQRPAGATPSMRAGLI